MKKLSLLFTFIVSFFVFSLDVFAAVDFSVSESSVVVGDEFTVYVKMESVAAWNIHVSSKGPVDDCFINEADVTADAMDIDKTFSATCKATGVGKIEFVLDGDVTSASDGVPVLLSESISVVVNESSSVSKDKVFTVSLNVNGGVLSGDDTLSCIANDASCEVTGLPKAEKKGYKFIGWSSSLDCSDVNSDEIILTSNREYYACYTSLSDDDIVDNPKTGNVFIVFVCFIGISMLICSLYYFKKIKRES